MFEIRRHRTHTLKVQKPTICGHEEKGRVRLVQHFRALNATLHIVK